MKFGMCSSYVTDYLACGHHLDLIPYSVCEFIEQYHNPWFQLTPYQ